MKLLAVFRKVGDQTNIEVTVGQPDSMEFKQRLRESRLLTAICHSCCSRDNKDQLLICDKCGRGCHMFCLSKHDPVPIDDSWYCRICYLLSRIPRPMRPISTQFLQFLHLASSIRPKVKRCRLALLKRISKKGNMKKLKDKGASMETTSNSSEHE
ncbi:hypothetical protein L6452_40232 [Arctium lappa]|uniref:Uncharacterized protein n=1 Tax=Arctium lappa TaxID=4217 RepID=A0ACB8XLP8_ARCLA|nr:hypothetical protein L6452_40232 [Arctium lappa]